MLSVFHTVTLWAMLVFGYPARIPGEHAQRMLSVGSRISDDTTRATRADSVPPLLGSSLRYGIDTTVSPCLDFYQYVNGGWRSRTVLGGTAPRKVEMFGDTYTRTRQRLQILLDSARGVVVTTKDPTLRVLGTFYGSCQVVDSLERPPLRAGRVTTPLRDSTRAEQCVQRTMTYLGGALGQAFAQDLLAANARVRMEHLLAAIRAAIVVRLKAHPWMTPTEKTAALEQLARLQLRIGMPKELNDYQALRLSPTDYAQNKVTIKNFENRQWIQSIGGHLRDRWKLSLLTPNALYSTDEHVVEIPAVMFMPPFFDANGEDAINFAGVGLVLAHEIFHSLSFSEQLVTLERPEMKIQIAQFKALNSTLGTLDGWDTNGERTYLEDVADLGGVLVAYDAWQATMKTRKKPPSARVDGYTPDQRFFVALGRVWRAKWQGSVLSRDVHAAPFARVNAMVRQAPAFANAFGCQETDPMVLSPNKRASIW